MKKPAAESKGFSGSPEILPITLQSAAAFPPHLPIPHSQSFISLSLPVKFSRWLLWIVKKKSVVTRKADQITSSCVLWLQRGIGKKKARRSSSLVRQHKDRRKLAKFPDPKKQTHSQELKHYRPHAKCSLKAPPSHPFIPPLAFGLTGCSFYIDRFPDQFPHSKRKSTRKIKFYTLGLIKQKLNK